MKATAGFTFAVTLMTSLALPAVAQAGLSPEVAAIQSRWDEINFNVAEKERPDAMENLVEECDTLLEQQRDNPEALTWCGIVNSTHAGLASKLSAMKYAKKARASLEHAIELDEEVLSGAACTSLGTLYFKVPGWPLGFADEDKARELLERGLALDPSGIDSNYFYADFLYDQGDYEQAMQFLGRAEAAAPRPGREVADVGRRRDIAALRERIDSKMEHN